LQKLLVDCKLLYSNANVASTGKSAEESSNTQKKRRITTQASPVHAPPLVVKEKHKMKVRYDCGSVYQSSITGSNEI